MKLRIVTRLTLWYVAVLAVIAGALGTFLVVRVHADLVQSLDVQLATRAEQMAAERNVPDSRERPDLVSLPAVSGLSSGEYLAQEIPLDGGAIERLGEAPPQSMLSPTMLARAERHAVRTSVVIKGEAFRVVAFKPQGRDRVVLLLGKSLEGVDETTRHLAYVLLLCAPVALALAALGGLIVSRRALAPIDAITNVAAAINADDLTARVAVPPADDEVAHLARTFNMMLARVEEALDGQRAFVADAAHELRTPLAIMRAELDVALRGDLSRDALESVRDEVERLTRIAENLLALARLDEGKLELFRSDVDLADVATDIARAMNRLATQRQVRLSADGGPARVPADRDRMRQVVLNLVDNAVGHSNAGSEIHITTGADARSAFVRVADAGTGIAEEELLQIFDRFYSAPGARWRPGGGVGLGLAICKGITDAHGGTIEIESVPGRGTTCTVRLPIEAGARLDPAQR
jgi:heavy metal sensor kinase